MARRGETPKRKILADPKYRDRLVSKFTNVIMFSGKRSVVVVLPASMWAMMPILRVLSSGYSRDTGSFSVTLE